MWVDGRDATALVRSEAVGMAASTLSAIPEVRLRAAAATTRLRPGTWIGCGRARYGTVVFTDAALKIYLTTTAEVQAARRVGQVAAQRQRMPPIRKLNS